MKYMLVAVLSLFILATGCAKNPNTGTNEPNPNVKVKQTAPEQPIDASWKEIAAHLEQLATSIPEVESARCVVVGKTAIVGINVPGDWERSRVDTIKYSVAEALRKDPYGVNALVTADMDINTRIQEIAEDIRGGRPLAGFAEELGDIIGRIIPIAPNNMLPEDNPPAKNEDVDNFIKSDM